jgi:uncharacterized protein YlxP (DUF503 family)
MFTVTLKITLRAPWVHSLKEKRMIIKSLTDKLASRFHVSAAEVDCQDIHQILVVGVAFVAGSSALADRMADKILSFIEDTQEAQITDIERNMI